MCIWGESQSMQIYQWYRFIMGTARVLLTQAQAQLLPIAPVLLLVESHKEPRSSVWKDELQGG